VTEVRAAGGVVWRAGPSSREVVVVHRPKYDDWTFPKGKADPGESDEDCARREVKEETGLTCVLGPALPATSYRDRFDRPKIVHYWAMRPTAGEPFAANDEVDELRWVAVPEARRLLSYERDLDVLDNFADLNLDGDATLLS